MPSCVVKWCRSHTKIKCTGIKFHKFPVDEERRSKWTNAVRHERRDAEWMPSRTSTVCSIHFKETDFYTSPKGNEMLKKTAVPVCTMVGLETAIKNEAKHVEAESYECAVISEPLLFIHFPDLNYSENNAQEIKQEQTSSYECNEEAASTSKIAVEKDDLQYNLEDTEVESILDSPKTYQLKQKLEKKTLLAQKRLSKIKLLQRRNKRLANRNIVLKNIIKELKKERDSQKKRIDRILRINEHNDSNSV